MSRHRTAPPVTDPSRSGTFASDLIGGARLGPRPMSGVEQAFVVRLHLYREATHYGIDGMESDSTLHEMLMRGDADFDLLAHGFTAAEVVGGRTARQDLLTARAALEEDLAFRRAMQRLFEMFPHGDKRVMQKTARALTEDPTIREMLAEETGTIDRLEKEYGRDD